MRIGRGFSLLFLLLIGLFGWWRMEEDRFSDKALIKMGRELPSIPLEAIADVPSWDVSAMKKPAFVNVFASWCAACHLEHGAISEFKILPVYGLAWRDKPKDTKNWLKRNGNPYAAVGVDVEGVSRASLELIGVPETYLIGSDGRILYKYVGPISREMLEKMATLAR